MTKIVADFLTKTFKVNHLNLILGASNIEELILTIYYGL